MVAGRMQVRQRLEEHISSIGLGTHQQIGDFDETVSQESRRLRLRRRHLPSPLDALAHHNLELKSKAKQAKEVDPADKITKQQVENLEHK